MTTNVDICNMALANIGEAPNITAISPPDGSAHADLCALWLPKAREAVLEMHNWTFAARRAVLEPVTVAVSSVSTATNRITTSTTHGLIDNDRVQYTAVTTMPTGLVALTDYYVRYVSTTVIELATAADGDAIDITGAGAGAMTLEKQSDRSSWLYAYAVPTDMLKATAVVPHDVGDEDYPNQLVTAPVSSWGLRPMVTASGGYLAGLTAQQFSPIPFKVELNSGSEPVIYTNCEDADLRYQAYVTDPTQWPPLFQQAVVWQLASWLAGAVKRDNKTSDWCLGRMSMYLSKAAESDSNQATLPMPQSYPWSR